MIRRGNPIGRINPMLQFPGGGDIPTQEFTERVQMSVSEQAAVQGKPRLEPLL